ncbi:hypothetical protein WAE61_18285 [Comamonadaceae bacterium PP-2]
MTKKRENNVPSLAKLQAKFRRPEGRYHAIHYLRASIPEALFFRYYREMFSLKQSLKDYHGASFPRFANQMFATRTPRENVNAYREILWATARALQFGDDLEAFVALRDEYEISVARNKHEEAVACLDKAEQQFGKSVWLYQNRIASAYLSDDSSQPSVVATMVMDEVNDNYLLKILMHYIRKRVEGAVLRDKLREELERQVEGLNYGQYFLAKLFDTTVSREDNVNNLLYFDSRASLVDHYCSLIQALSAAASDLMFSEEMLAALLPSLKKLYGVTRDRRLSGILTILGEPVSHKTCDIATHAKALELYTAGDYAECINLSEEVLLVDPLNTALRIVVAKSKAELRIEMVAENNIGSEIEGKLVNLFSANENFFSSAHAILVLTDRFIDHVWLQQLRVAIYYEIGAEEAKKNPIWLRDMHVRDSYLSPMVLMAINGLAHQKAKNLLEEGELYPRTLSLVVEAMSNSLDVNNSMLNARTARYKARRLLSEGHYSESAALYRFASKNESRKSSKLRAQGGAALALMLDQKYEEAIDEIVDAHLGCRNAPILLPFTDIVEKLPIATFWPETISLPILLGIYSDLDESGDLSRQRLSLELFCLKHGITTPNDLLECISKFGSNKVVAFLEDVWKPEFMRQTLLYSNDVEIEEARIEVCRALMRANPETSRVYQEELASRIKQQEISKATMLVEQSRVYVDIEAIKRSLKSRLKSSYAQYKNTIGLSGKSEDGLVGKFQEIFSGYEGSESLSNIFSKMHIIDADLPNTPQDVQFRALYQEIAKEFLFGDHGLNAYLSTRVRHGKFIDALRKAVMDEHIVTAQANDTEYAYNDYWNKDPDVAQKGNDVVKALQDFTTEFDKLLIYVRDVKIQIRTYLDLVHNDGNSESLFVYQSSYLERKLMQEYDVEFKDFDELVIKCVDTMWEKTDASLKGVRDYLSTEFRNRILNLFSVLMDRMAIIFSGDIPGSLANGIAKSRTATQQALEGVVSWFKRSEVYDRKDFEIDLAPEIAANMVKRTLYMSGAWQNPECSVEADSPLPGRTLDTLVDIYYALFENAVKYSQQECIPARVRLNISYMAGEFKARVVSDAKPPNEEGLMKLKQIRESLATSEFKKLAQSEGKSGFRKINLALTSPIYKNPSLSFAHALEGEFVVEFSFRIA